MGESLQSHQKSINFQVSILTVLSMLKNFNERPLTNSFNCISYHFSRLRFKMASTFFQICALECYYCGLSNEHFRKVMKEMLVPNFLGKRVEVMAVAFKWSTATIFF
jgi:hypothetical protein